MLRPLTAHHSLLTHLGKMVRVVGFEPTTSCAQGTRATQLRHTLNPGPYCTARRKYVTDVT
jgi:hypothetical protein